MDDSGSVMIVIEVERYGPGTNLFLFVKLILGPIILTYG